VKQSCKKQKVCKKNNNLVYKEIAQITCCKNKQSCKRFSKSYRKNVKQSHKDGM